MTRTQTNEEAVLSLGSCMTDPAAFLAEHWSRRPLLDRGAAQRFSGLLDEAEVEELVGGRGLRLPAFRMVREGALIGTDEYTMAAPIGQGEVSDLIDPEGVVRLFEEGATLILRGLERYHPAIAAFCGALAGRHRPPRPGQRVRHARQRPRTRDPLRPA